MEDFQVILSDFKLLLRPANIIFGYGVISLTLWLLLGALALWWSVLLIKGGPERVAGVAYGLVRVQSLLLQGVCAWQIIAGFCCVGAFDAIFVLNTLVTTTTLTAGMACLAAATVATRVRFRAPPELGLLNVASVLASVFDITATLICLELIILA